MARSFPYRRTSELWKPPAPSPPPETPSPFGSTGAPTAPSYAQPTYQTTPLSPGGTTAPCATKSADPLPRTGCAEIRVRTARSEEHTSELQSLMRTSYAVFCWKKNNNNNQHP